MEDPLNALIVVAESFGIDFLYAAVLGLMLGSAELMGRYRDEPVRVFQSGYAWVYVGVNGILAVISLYLIQRLGLSFVPDDAGSSSVDSARIYDVMTAGFGGAAFFRSSVMRTKVGDTDVAIGPAIVIDTLLKVTDRGVDRYRARRRADDIAAMMNNVNLDQASRLVIPFCTALMQNVAAAERENLQQAVLSLGKDTNIDSKTKPMILGLRLVNIVGFGVLQSAIGVLREQKLLGTGKQRAEETVFDRIRRSLASAKQAAGASPAPAVVTNGGAADPTADSEADDESATEVQPTAEIRNAG